MERLTQVQNLDPTGANISKYVYGFDDTDDIEKIMLRGGNGEILEEPIEWNPLAPFHVRYYYNDGSGNVVT